MFIFDKMFHSHLFSRPSSLEDGRWQKHVANQYRDWLTAHGPSREPIPLFIPSQPSLDIVITGDTQLHQRVTANLANNTFTNWRLTDLHNLRSEFILLVDAKTELWPNALDQIVLSLNQQAEGNLFYYDSEYFDQAKNCRLPYFKPDYSPDLLLSTYYLGSPLVIRRSLLQSLATLNTSDPLLLWDIALQAVEKTDRIVHSPIILSTEQAKRLQPSGFPVPSPGLDAPARLMLTKTLKRRGLRAKIATGPFEGSYRIIYQPDNQKATIIISTKDRADLLKKCVDGILNNNNYPHWELIIVNNNSVEPETFEYFKSLENNRKIRVINYPKPFNIAEIYNMAVKQAEGHYIVFMGNDTEPISHDWLARLLGYLQRSNVGAVGAKLLFPDQTIQHAGVILGYGSAADNSDRVAGHCYSHFVQHHGYFGAIDLQRNYSAVTGAVIATRRSTYQEVGGFDAKNLRILFNDVDYCLKLRQKGYLIIYAPEVVLYHRERASLGEAHVSFKMDPKEIEYMRRVWQHWEDNDPYYNPNLTLDHQDYSLREIK